MMCRIAVAAAIVNAPCDIYRKDTFSADVTRIRVIAFVLVLIVQVHRVVKRTNKKVQSSRSENANNLDL